MKSAGIILTRKETSSSPNKYLMLRAYSYWDFPKGQLHEGEEELTAALRETKEETCIKDVIIVDTELWMETEPYGPQNKIARYYIGTTDTETIIMPVVEKLGKPEHDEYRWLTFDEAMALPLCQRIRNVLRWAKGNIE